MEENMTMDVRS